MPRMVNPIPGREKPKPLYIGLEVLQSLPPALRESLGARCDTENDHFPKSVAVCGLLPVMISPSLGIQARCASMKISTIFMGRRRSSGVS
jgi:hypothetical protein